MKAWQAHPFGQEQPRQHSVDADFRTLGAGETFHEMKASSFGDGIAHAASAGTNALDARFSLEDHDLKWRDILRQRRR